MNRQELSEYRGLVVETAGIRRQLDLLKVKLEPGSIDPGKAPSKGAHSDIRGDLLAAYVDKMALYTDKLKEIEHKKTIIEFEISKLPALERAIIRGRYIEGLPIWKIAQEVRYSERQTARLLNQAIEGMESDD